MLIISRKQMEAPSEAKVLLFQKRVKYALQSEPDCPVVMTSEDLDLFVAAQYKIATQRVRMRTEREIYVYILAVYLLGESWWTDHPDYEAHLLECDQSRQRKDFLIDLIRESQS